MPDQHLQSKSVYCVVCRRHHEPPVAVAVGDRCPTRDQQQALRLQRRQEDHDYDEWLQG